MLPIIREPWQGNISGERDGHMTERVVSKAESDGGLLVLRATLQPDSAPPLHQHAFEDETWIVLSGEVKFWMGAEFLKDCTTSIAKPGAVVFGPRGVPHTFQTYTRTAEILVFATPGGIEDFLFSDEHDAVLDGNGPAIVESVYGIKILDRAPMYGQD